jgi:hypothetical protein
MAGRKKSVESFDYNVQNLFGIFRAYSECGRFPL